MIVARLLDATPPPPTTDDVDELLAAADQMMQLREAILRDAVPEPARADLLAELMRRQDMWETRLVAARASVGAARIAHGRARRVYR